jgi:hypothetical protein
MWAGSSGLGGRRFKLGLGFRRLDELHVRFSEEATGSEMRAGFSFGVVYLTWKV